LLTGNRKSALEIRFRFRWARFSPLLES
jgi:hypothetical protein